MEISKIRTLVSRAGEMQGLVIVDLVYLDGIPYAVFEWDKKEGADPVPLYLSLIHIYSTLLHAKRPFHSGQRHRTRSVGG